MKTLINKETLISKYILEDSEEVYLLEDRVMFKDFVISDMNISNTEIVDVENVPLDWKGNTYMYNDGWIKIPEEEIFDSEKEHLLEKIRLAELHLNEMKSKLL